MLIVSYIHDELQGQKANKAAKLSGPSNAPDNDEYKENKK